MRRPRLGRREAEFEEAVEEVEDDDDEVSERKSGQKEQEGQSQWEEGEEAVRSQEECRGDEEEEERLKRSWTRYQEILIDDVQPSFQKTRMTTQRTEWARGVMKVDGAREAGGTNGPGVRAPVRFGWKLTRRGGSSRRKETRAYISDTSVSHSAGVGQVKCWPYKSKPLSTARVVDVRGEGIAGLKLSPVPVEEEPPTRVSPGSTARTQ